MFIKKIISFDKESGEADVCVSDGTYEVLCYSCSFSEMLKSKQIDCIYAFGCEDVYKSSLQSFDIIKNEQYYAYFFVAQVISKSLKRVRVGELIIEIDSYIPNDIFDGEYVWCSAQRFDV
ncbi:MAG: hypothetical protein IKB38_07245 [Clostridia bacterium]|nr:hypothetical protein [Clostridia bacterium]